MLQTILKRNERKLSRLQALFQQRAIGPTYGSVSSRIPMRFPSGAQFTESELETDLVLQLAFSMRTSDLITQPIIYYAKGGKQKQYTPDVLVETLPDRHQEVAYYLIEAKPAEHLQAFLDENEEKIGVAKKWCAENGGLYRIVTETEIRTPYAKNARLLGRFVGRHPEPATLSKLERICRERLSVGETIQRLRDQGIVESQARLAIEQSVANRLLHCDLSEAFDDQTRLMPAALADFEDDARDPFLKLLKRRNPGLGTKKQHRNGA